MLLVQPELATSEDQVWDTPFATAENMERFYAHLEQTLVEIGFLDPENPRIMMRRLRRLYNRARPTVVEMNILRGILTASQKAKRTVEPK